MALTVIWVSVAIGAALGLSQRFTVRATGPIRTFAVVAAALVVGLSLLPHAVASQGAWGLLAALAGFVAIPLGERLIQRLLGSPGAPGLRLEMGFLGLLLHRFGDGVAMSVEGHGRELLWALGAHEIPIVALVTLAYAPKGLAQSLLRVTLLGVSSSLGLWWVSSLPHTWADLHGWADAVAAGILVHVVAHEAFADQLQTSRDRALDVAAGLLGLAIVLVPSAEHTELGPSLGQRMLAHTLDMAPMLSLSLIGSAALLTLGGRAKMNRWLQRSGATPRLIDSVWLGDPRLGLVAVLLSVWLLGWAFALLQLCGMLVVGLLAGMSSSTPMAPAPSEASAPGAQCPPALGTRFWAALEQLSLRGGGGVLFGVLGASYVDAFLPPSEALSSRGGLWTLALLSAIALPASVCTIAAVPLAAAFVAKGVSPGVALAGLMLGPAAHFASVTFAKTAGKAAGRSAWLIATLPGAAGLGLLAQALLNLRATTAQPAPTAGPLQWLALGVLGIALGKGVWQVGIRGWLGVSLNPHGPRRRRNHLHAPVH